MATSDAEWRQNTLELQLQMVWKLGCQVGQHLSSRCFIRDSMGPALWCVGLLVAVILVAGGGMPWLAAAAIISYRRR